MTRSGFDRDQRLVVEAEAAHGLGREVLRHGVGPLDNEAAHELDGLRVLEIQGDVELARR